MTVSVALCSYNGSKYIAEQLESIALQTRKVDELVICDDCSKDNTEEIVNQFIKLHPQLHVRFYENDTNVGFLRNFEQALQRCTSDLIFLSDQDDIWLPDKVEIFCDYFNEHPNVDVAFSNARLINASGTAEYDQTLFDVVGLDEYNKKLFRKGYAQELLATSGRVTGCTTAIRSSFLPYCLPFSPMYVKPIHDEVIAVSAASVGRLGFIDICLIKYRQHDGQTIGISLLFKFPPPHNELASRFRTWDKRMLDPVNITIRGKLDFIEKRFWVVRSKFSLLRIISMYVSGQYGQHYIKPFEPFSQDLIGVIIRIWKRINDFKMTRLTYDCKR